jgi:hypothetical protein
VTGRGYTRATVAVNREDQAVFERLQGKILL